MNPNQPFDHNISGAPESGSVGVGGSHTGMVKQGGSNCGWFYYPPPLGFGWFVVLLMRHLGTVWAGSCACLKPPPVILNLRPEMQCRGVVRGVVKMLAASMPIFGMFSRFGLAAFFFLVPQT